MSEEFGQAWVVKTTHKGTGRPVEGVFDELRRGCARIGWSELDHHDLRKIDAKRKKGESLDPGEKATKRCLRFFTEVREEDLLLYPHQPERGQFSIARVTGEYDYDGGLESGDFRSVLPCELITEIPVHMRDEIVPSVLRHRLGRPGRFSKIYETGPLFDFVGNLPKAGQTRDGSGKAGIDRIHAKLREELPDAIRQEFSRADLSRQFCHQLFERMGYNHEVQEGRGEAGADIVVEVGNPLLPDEGFRVGVQAFAYGGNVREGSLERKLNQLLEGWETNDLDYGVLLTTGIPTGEALEVLVSHNEENPDRHVKLIDGDALADLFLQHFPPAEGGAGSGP